MHQIMEYVESCRYISLILCFLLIVIIQARKFASRVLPIKSHGCIIVPILRNC